MSVSTRILCHQLTCDMKLTINIAQILYNIWPCELEKYMQMGPVYQNDS